MNRTTLNFLVDGLLLALFLALVWVSVVLRFLFPPGTAAAGWSLWGLGYDGWCAVQFNVLAAMFLVVLLHVMLHWSWVCGVVSKGLRRRGGPAQRIDEGLQTIYGVGTLIAIVNLLGFTLAAAALMVHAAAS